MATNGKQSPNGRNNSNIPLLRKPSVSRTNSNSSIGSNPTSPISKIPITGSIDKWREKYELTEQRRKIILIENEKTLRQFNELNRNYLDAQIKNELLETELFETNEKFTKLRLASETLFKEYETLKHLYETETGAMARALKDASQWYQENKELRRRTLLIVDRDTVDEGVDADTDSTGTDSDIENLNRTIKQLSGEVAELQTEVESVRNAEFLANEENVRLVEALDAERTKSEELEGRLGEVTNNYQQVIRVSDLLTKEIRELKRSEEDQRNNATVLRREADGFKKERNILAHQSTLLLEGLSGNDSPTDCLRLLQDIEQLKRQLEDDRFRYEEEAAALQDRLEELENNPRVEVLEERLKLAEAELQRAAERARRAEDELRALRAPPPPPPPPPAPTAPLRAKRRAGAAADAGGAQEAAPAVPTATEDVINAIKMGHFSLRKAKSEKKERDGSKAVSEILNMLGNLRRTPKKRQSIIAADVHL